VAGFEVTPEVLCFGNLRLFCGFPHHRSFLSLTVKRPDCIVLSTFRQAAIISASKNRCRLARAARDDLPTQTH
jgi:hypothetical protein